MAASRRKKTKVQPVAKAGLLTTLGDRIKKMASGFVKRRKKRKPAKKATVARKKRSPRAKKPSA